MEITQIKSLLSIKTVLSHYGLSPDKYNRVCCPFHDDKRPSLQIYPTTNTWTCFSTACDAGSGDTIDFIMRIENGKKAAFVETPSAKHEAIEKAKQLLGEPIIPSTTVTPKTTPTEKAKPIPAQIPLARIKQLSKEFTDYRSILKKHPQALAYLAERKLSLSKLDIGYNDGSHPDLKHCIIFQLKDKNNQTVSMYGRSIYDNDKARHYYLKNRQGLYPGYPAAASKRLIITESIIDAASLLQHFDTKTDYSILALYGTNGLNSEHTKAIEQLKNLKEIILFLDGDAAGRAAVKQHSQTLHELLATVTISRVITPEGKDVNSLLQQYGKETLKTLLKERVALSFSIEKNKNNG